MRCGPRTPIVPTCEARSGKCFRLIDIEEKTHEHLIYILHVQYIFKCELRNIINRYTIWPLHGCCLQWLCHASERLHMYIVAIVNSSSYVNFVLLQYFSILRFKAIIILTPKLHSPPYKLPYDLWPSLPSTDVFLIFSASDESKLTFWS